jgi:hypothetical protein
MNRAPHDLERGQSAVLQQGDYEMTTIQEQLTIAGGTAIEIRTLSVRVAPLSAAMLAQVPDVDILDSEAATLRGEPIGKVCLPGKTQLLWLHGRDIRRCVIPETARCAPLSAEERALRDHVQAERRRLDTAVKAVTKASRFAALAGALSTNGEFRGGDWQVRLGEILGSAAHALEEADARGEVGPAQLEGPKARVLAALEADKARIETSAEDLARLAVAREAKDAELATLMAQLASVDQVYLP